ncbi:MAG TPA: hypothetical protein VN083_09245 [Vicinamibacteria bacterium]|nr:hypothetical protein [Vicinamibacteria bacterium]
MPLTARLLALVMVSGAAGARAAEGPLFRYDVTALEGARVLSVEARFPSGALGSLDITKGFFTYLDGLERERGGTWAETRPLLEAACPEAGCHLRYRLRLGDAAQHLRDRSRVFELNGALVAQPGSWLLRPSDPPAGARFRLAVKTPPGIAFETGIFPGTGEGVYEGLVSDLDDAPYSAFGPFDEAKISVRGATIQVAITPGEKRVSRDDLLDWVRRAGEAVSGYFDRFPMPRALVLVGIGGRRDIGGGTTMGNGGGSIMVFVGKAAQPEDLRDDWVLTHEMIHLALPDLMPHHWLEEGIATYVEPLARARAGFLTDEVVWRGLAQGLPNGLPGPGDRGLDRTHTWGRTYWGGALFCFLADLEIRKQTHGRRSLQDALRGVLGGGGNLSIHWDVDRFLAEGDRATGVPVLSEMYARMAQKPAPVDLDGLWQELGVSLTKGGVRFDDRAPLAAIRRSFTLPAESPTPLTR